MEWSSLGMTCVTIKTPPRVVTDVDVMTEVNGAHRDFSVEYTDTDETQDPEDA